MKKFFQYILLITIFFFLLTVDVYAEKDNSGWYNVGESVYYKNEKGENLVGFQQIEGKYYFFSQDESDYGRQKTGMLTIGEYNYYMNPYATTGWFEYNGNKYYANEKGEIQVGFTEIEGKTYFLSGDRTKYGAVKTGMLTIGDYNYYLNPDLNVGWFEYNGNKYYANEKGQIQVGFTEIDGKIYFLSRDRTKYGAVKTGMLTIGDYNYYLNPDAVTGWFEYNGNEYYANEKGEIQVGFTEIEGKTYFLSRDRTKYGSVKTGMLTIGDYNYYLNPNLNIGWFEYNGNKYYANEKGEIQVGFTEIEGKTYFLSRDRTKYGAVKTGMLTIGDYNYYLNPDAAIGWFEYNGNKYYANEKGEIQVGFTEIEGKTYFLSGDRTKYGSVKTGMLTIGDYNYYLNPNLNIGWFEYNGNKYYANEKGQIQLGFQTINNNNYFFTRAKEKYGAMRTGWVSIGMDYYYYQADGIGAKGIVNIDGREYKFNEQTSKLEGFVEKDGKLYYYNPDGTQAKGIQYMTNQFWKFNEITGEFEKFVREVRTIDVSTHQGVIDWDAVKASGKVDAVILRLGYGVGYIDSKFIRNKNELERLGIPYSVYLFSYAESKNESLMESNFLVNTLNSTNAKIASNIFSLYYDLEDWEIKSTGENSYGISKDTYGEMITTFIENTEKKTCIKTRVYASKSYIENRFPEDKQQYATWVAQWNDTLTYKGPYEGWQYSDCEYIPGINGCVDMSKFYY